MAWGHKNILHDEPHIALVDKESGDVVHNAFVTTKGTVVEPRNIQIVALNLNQP
jgi:23S rRNA-/tRNA-specific pseudouridylate synthase